MISEDWAKSCHMNPDLASLQIIDGDYHSRIMPSMNSLEVLLSKLPSVTSDQHFYNGNASQGRNSSRTLNAPTGDYWLQKPFISNITSLPPTMLATSHLDCPHSLGNAFVIADSSSEYSYLGDPVD